MKRGINLVTIVIPMFILLAVALIPYVWIFLTSFKGRADIMNTTPQWLFEPSMANYLSIFHKDFDVYLTNSIIIGFSSTCICVVIGTLAAYCFSRYKVPAGNHLFFYILATRLGSAGRLWCAYVFNPGQTRPDKHLYRDHPGARHF